MELKNKSRAGNAIFLYLLRQRDVLRHIQRKFKITARQKLSTLCIHLCTEKNKYSGLICEDNKRSWKHFYSSVDGSNLLQ